MTASSVSLAIYRIPYGIFDREDVIARTNSSVHHCNTCRSVLHLSTNLTNPARRKLTANVLGPRVGVLKSLVEWDVLGPIVGCTSPHFLKVLANPVDLENKLSK